MVSTDMNIVAIRGGGIPLDAPLNGSWTLRYKLHDGKKFISVAPNDYFTKKFLQNKTAMVDKIKSLRNDAVIKQMRQLSQTEDVNNPDADDASDAMPKRPKRELVDDIQKVMTLQVATTNSVQHSVNVLSTWRENSTVTIELTDVNLELLLEEPEIAHGDPLSIKREHVHWRESRHALVMRYHDGPKQKWRHMFRKMENAVGSHGLQAEVDEVAQALEEIYEKKHTEPPRDEEGCEGDDTAS